MNSLFHSVIGSGIIVFGILAIRKLGMGKITRKLQYSLWLILPLYLFFSTFFCIKIPVAVGQIQMEKNADKADQNIGTSYMQDTSTFNQNSYLEEASTLLTDKSGGGKNNENEMMHGADKDENLNKKQVYLKEIWKCLRTGIALLLFLVFLINNIIFIIGLVSKRQFYITISPDDMLKDNSEFFKRKNRIQKNFDIYFVNAPSTPFLFGKKIYLHSDMVKDQEQMRYMVLHEICHFCHKDMVWNILKSLCCALYWFNPFVWIASYYAGRDCELACDEAVIHMVGTENQKAYGVTLIRLISEKQKAHGFTIGTTMKGRKSMIKERIFLIAQTFTKSRKGTLGCLTCVFLLTGCALMRPYASEQPMSAIEYRQAETENSTNTAYQLTSEESNLLMRENQITDISSKSIQGEADSDSIFIKNNCYNPIKRNENILFYGTTRYLQGINLETNEVVQLMEGNIKPGFLQNDILYYIKYPADAGEQAGIGYFNLTTGENEILISWKDELWGCANMLIEDNCLYLEVGHSCEAYLLENQKVISANDLQNQVLKAIKLFDLTENEISGINYGFVNSILEYAVFTTLNRQNNELRIYDANAQTVRRKENCLGNVIVCDRGIVYMNLEGNIILNRWADLESDQLLFSPAAAGYSVNYGTYSDAGLYVFRENGDSVECKCITWEGKIVDVVNIPDTRMAIELNFSAFTDFAAYCKDGEIHICQFNN